MPRYKRLTPPASESQPSGLGQRLEQIGPIKLFGIARIDSSAVRGDEHKACSVPCHLASLVPIILMPDIDFYKLDTAFALLTQFDHCAKNDDFIEASLWHNGEGFDAHISSTNRHQTISLTWGEYKALKTIVKKLDK